MSEIIPIRDLKDTTSISEKCHKVSEPIFITKNGYGDMVIMGIEYYDRIINSIDRNGVYSLKEISIKLTPIFQKYKVKSAILFGSYAKGLATKDSDIDILVDSGLKGLSFFGLLEEVKESLKIEVDLLDIKEIIPNSRIDQEIKKSGVRIFG